MTGAGRWRRRPTLSWSGLLSSLALLAPVWLPALLWAAGVIAEKTAGLLVTIYCLVLIVGRGVVALLAWVVAWWPTEALLLPSTGRASPSVPCDVAGCRATAQYEIRLDRIVDGPAVLGVMLGPTGSPELMEAARDVFLETKHLCGAHSRALEAAMGARVADPAAVTALLAAQADLEEAARLAPAEPAIRQNLGRIEELLATVRGQGNGAGKTRHGVR